MKLRPPAVAALALVLAGCGGVAPAETAGPQDRTLTVFAAASLTDVFTELETRFEAGNPGVEVVLNLGASSDLAQQLVNGGPADVFASASTSTMATVTEAGLVEGTPEVFARNRLQIVTAPGNPEGVTGFADLARPDLQVVVCAPQVPCGAAAERIEEATGITLTPVSEEPDVRSTLGRVSTGNADAGLVYVTDVLAAGADVQGITFPESGEAVNTYPVVALKDAADADLAQDFVDLVVSDTGQSILAAAGFARADDRGIRE